MDTSFIDQLKQSLAASLNPDATLRQQAEQFLLAAQSRPDYCSSILEVSADTSLDQNLALAAAVQLGTMIDWHWKFFNTEQAEKITVQGFRYVILTEEDKNYVRTNIVSKMYNCTNRAIQKQYVRSIITVCRFDYPEKWPTITQDISNALQSGNDRGIYTGCIALYCLLKKYEFEIYEGRGPLVEVMTQVSPMLQQIVDQYTQNIAENEMAQTILHQIVKIFYTANQLQLSPFLRENNALLPWMQFFKIILDLPVPEHLSTPTEVTEEITRRDKSMIWKLKAQAARITFRLFMRYANGAKYSSNNVEESAFCQLFIENYSEMICESHLQLMFKKKDQFVGSKTLNFSIKLVSQATKVDRTMARLLPFIDTILYELAIPLMLVSTKDQELFIQDPTEYIRKQMDIMETIYMPKVTTSELLQHIVIYKSQKGKKVKPDYLVPFLGFASNNMQQYADALAAGSNPDWRVKEALLFSIGSLNETIRTFDDLAKNIEPMLQTHVLPDFQSAHPLLRARACWVYGEYSYYTFENKQHIQQAVEAIYQQLFSDSLPVRYDASLALSKMLKNEAALEFLKPALKNLLEVYLKIMEEIDSEELIAALEEIVEKFAADIGPFAIQLSQQLVTKYKTLVSEDNADDEDGEEERALAAASCVTAIRRILEAINKDKAGLAQLFPIIKPILMHSLTPDGLDCIDDGLDCINIFIYYACTLETRVPAELWTMLPQMMFITGGNDDDIDGGFAFEQLAQVVIVLQNFIAKDPQTFLSVGEGQTETYFELAVKFIRRILVVNSQAHSKHDGVTILRAVISIFENCPGQIDAALPMLVGMLLAETKLAFQEGSSCPKSYRSMLLQTLAMALYNNNVATLAVMENEQQTFFVFSNWIQFMPNFKLEFEIRRILFGLLAILRVQGAQMPQIVQQQLPAITQHIGKLTKQVYEERIKSLESNEKFVRDGFNSDDEDDDEDSAEENPNVDFERMKNALTSLKDGSAAANDDDNFSDAENDSEFEEQAGEFSLYDSPLEMTDELITVKNALDQIFQADASAYQYITSAQSEDERNKMIEILGKADELKQREAACKEAINAHEEAKKVKSIIA